jgi:Concanavalin A-like lectin/glucanases superfamily/Bacterial Ig domain/Immunoglobulin domain
MNNKSPFPSWLLCSLGLLLLTFAPPLKADYAGAVMADGPIAYYRFNDAGTTAANGGSLGATADGTYNGNAVAGDEAPRPPAFPGFEADNRALQLDGDGDYVGVMSSLLNGLSSYTLSGWIRRAAAQNTRTGLFGQNDKVEFGYIDDLTIQAWTDAALNLTPNPFPDGEWAHVAVVCDGTTISIYTNGVLAVSRTQTTRADSAFPFNIGGGGIFDDPAVNGNFFNGQIDEVALFDKALSPQQIAAHYFSAVPSPPVITVQPVGADVFEGANVTLSVEVVGTTPFTYQWLDFGFPIDGATGPTLEFMNISPDQGSAFQVEISNDYGSVVSDVAEIMVLPNPLPTITEDPQPATRLAGGSVRFQVVTAPGADITYQWQFNETDIPGATDSVLELTGLESGDAGSYRAVVSNPSGSVTSGAATLTVLVPEAGSYTEQVMAGSPIAYWQLDETDGDVAHDYAGGNDGTYHNVTLGAAGPIGGNTAADFDGASSYVSTVSGLLNGLEDFTLSGWIRRGGDQANRTGLFGQNDKVEFGYIDNGTLQAWTDNGLNVTNSPFPNGDWSFLALVSDGGTLTMYTNGLPAASRAHVTQADNANGFNIGGGGIFDDIAANGNWFLGQIDEVAVYDRALSSGEIVNQYYTAIPTAPIITAQPAGVTVFEGEEVTLSVTAMGTGPLQYQWLESGNPVAGATGSMLSFPSAVEAQSGLYQVVVSNGQGSVTSDVAEVVIQPNTPPVITQDPAPATRYAGAGVRFSVQATGSIHLDYQWQLNGADIPGATEATLDIANVQPEDQGDYRAVVSNAAGSVPSAAATLTVLVPEPGSYTAAVMAGGPLAYWKLDETEGAVAHDYAGGHDGTYHDVVQGASGPNVGDVAAGFNGSSSYVSTVPGLLNGLEDFTMTGWIQRGGDQANRTGLFGQNDKVEFGYINNDTIQAWTDNGLNVTPNPFPNGKWAQVALISDGGTLTLYTNGLAAASRTHVTQADNQNSFNIGGGGIFDDLSRNGNWFLGRIDEVAVYNRALSAGEVNALFELGAPVNRPPTCSPGTAGTDEDVAVDIPLPASDPNGDTLTFAIVDGPVNGTVSLNGGVATYKGSLNFSGTDSFTFQVSDGVFTSDVCPVTVTVNPVNDAPVAVIDVSPLSDLGPTVPGLIVISPNNSNACVTLDGGRSSDVDNDFEDLTFLWMVDGDVAGAGVITELCLGVGSHEITLMVDDGDLAGAATATVEVLPAAEAVEELIMVVNDSVIERATKRPFLATLKTAAAAFERGSFGSALNRLQNAFQNKVRAQVGKRNPDVAEEWNRIAQEIVDAFDHPQDCDCE